MNGESATGGVTHRVVVVALGRAATTASLFAVYAILARIWPAEQFGLFSAVWVLGNTLVPVFLLGLPTALLYFFPRSLEPGARRVLVIQVGACLLFSGLAGAGLLLAVGTQVASLLSLESLSVSGQLRSYLLPFLPYVFSVVAGGAAESVLVASGRVAQQALLAAATALGVVGAATLGAILDADVQEVLWWLSVVGLVRLVISYGLVARVVGFETGRAGVVERKGVRLSEVVGYALPIAANDGVGALSRSVDRLVVLYFFSAETFGLYHVGAIEVPVGLMLTAVVTVLIPEISTLHGKGQLDQIAELWKGAVARLALVIVPLFFFLFAFSEPIIGVYLPESYARSELVFRVFLLALPLRCAIYNPLLVGMGKARWALWAGLGDLAVNLLLSVVLVRLLMARRPDLAMLGPALATVTSTYLQVGALVWVISHQLNRGIGALLPWARLLKISAISAVACVAARCTVLAVEPPPAVELGVGAAVFGGVLAALMWSRRQDREELRTLVRSAMTGSGT